MYNNFKIVFKTPLNYAQFKDIENFLDLQQSTDRVRENTVFYYNSDEGNYLIKIYLDEYGEIKSIIIELLEF